MKYLSRLLTVRTRCCEKIRISSRPAASSRFSLKIFVLRSCSCCGCGANLIQLMSDEDQDEGGGAVWKFAQPINRIDGFALVIYPSIRKYTIQLCCDLIRRLMNRNDRDAGLVSRRRQPRSPGRRSNRNLTNRLTINNVAYLLFVCVRERNHRYVKLHR